MLHPRVFHSVILSSIFTTFDTLGEVKTLHVELAFQDYEEEVAYRVIIFI